MINILEVYAHDEKDIFAIQELMNELPYQKAIKGTIDYEFTVPTNLISNSLEDITFSGATTHRSKKDDSVLLSTTRFVDGIRLKGLYRIEYMKN